MRSAVARDRVQAVGRDAGRRLALALLSSSGVACGAEAVQLARRPPAWMDFVVVPRPPPVVPVEIQPPRPAAQSVWVPGSWTWRAGGFRWVSGAWVVPPAGASYSPWTWCYQADGQVRFWAAAWFGPEGQPLPSPRVVSSAGPRIDRR